ncbi:hypothetical protein BH20ACI4_BH20ACI4_26850 [soil metagenome]
MVNNFDLKFIVFLGIIFILIGSEKIYSQKYVEYSKISLNKNGKIEQVDLTQEIKKKCTKSIIKKYKNNFVELKYSSESDTEAENIFNAIEKSLNETQRILFPLNVEGIKFYLLQLDTIPSSYKIRDEIRDQNYFLFLWIFKNKNELNLECNQTDTFCENIFEHIPHELTHGAIGGFLNPKNTTWFEEGLGIYVGKEISNKYRPLAMQEIFKQVIPEVSLHRQDIRQNLLTWNQVSSLEKNNKFVKNEWFRYIAAGHLIKLLVENARKNGFEKPLEYLFEELIRNRNKKGKTVNATELSSLIEQNLKVDIKRLGILNNFSQVLLIEKALNLLNKNIDNVEDKNNSLIILASIEEIQLSEPWINLLLKELLLKKNSEYTRNLIATSLKIRINQPNFHDVLLNFLQENKITRKNKQILHEIENLSLR